MNIYIYIWTQKYWGFSRAERFFLFNIFLFFFFHYWFNLGSGVLCRHFLLVDYICVNVSNCRLIKQLHIPVLLRQLVLLDLKTWNLWSVYVCVWLPILLLKLQLSLVWCHPKSLGHRFYFSKKIFQCIYAQCLYRNKICSTWFLCFFYFFQFWLLYAYYILWCLFKFQGFNVKVFYHNYCGLVSFIKTVSANNCSYFWLWVYESQVLRWQLILETNVLLPKWF